MSEEYFDKDNKIRETMSYNNEKPKRIDDIFWLGNGQVAKIMVTYENYENPKPQVTDFDIMLKNID